MDLVDTHCHLNLDVFQDTLQEVLERAQLAGVNKMVVPGVDLVSSEKAVDLASRYESLYAAVGIHPNEADRVTPKDLVLLEQLAQSNKVVAIGEIGLDYYHHPENQAVQERLFEAMLELAVKMDKPLILHSRNAIARMIEIVSAWIARQSSKINGIRGVFHAFEGTPAEGAIVHKMNFFLGIGGPVTYKNAHQKHEIPQKLGSAALVLETDAPYLAPHPFRGQINEPCRIVSIAQQVASLLEQDVDAIAETTSKNAHTLFRWDEQF